MECSTLTTKRARGDYQTPVPLAKQVCAYLYEVRKLRPQAVLEPTCGLGAFITASTIFKAREYVGIELNPDYCQYCRDHLAGDNLTIVNADILTTATRPLIHEQPLLIVGNPPWVNQATLSALEAAPAPTRSAKDFALSGLAAITGESNFDIATAITLQLIAEYQGTNTTIALLCKSTVAIKVFQELKRRGISFTCCNLLRIDAAKAFGVDVSAVLLVVELTAQRNTPAPDICSIYDLQQPLVVLECCGYLKGRFYRQLPLELATTSGLSSAINATTAPTETTKVPASAPRSSAAMRQQNPLSTDLTTLTALDGQCQQPWRQGIKHDCVAIMELTPQEQSPSTSTITTSDQPLLLNNGLGEHVEVEPEWVFPLVKSSHLKEPLLHSWRKYVLVHQRKLHEDTAHLEQDAPLLWAYLHDHAAYFTRRKSRIYRERPAFTLFGIGDYSFAPYKVAVSGFAQQPLFCLLDGTARPVMTDDTCYFLSFTQWEVAYVTMLLLNSPRVQSFYGSIALHEAKRPLCKKVLARLDLLQAAAQTTLEELQETELKLHLAPRITAGMRQQWVVSISKATPA